MKKKNNPKIHKDKNGKMKNAIQQSTKLAIDKILRSLIDDINNIAA